MINEEYINKLLKQKSIISVDDILKKSEKKTRLSLEEVATLLNTPQNFNEKIFNAASKLKNDIYGKRLVFFAPLYLSNVCINDCKYCGFKSSNDEFDRITLSQKEIREEVTNILKQGHKRILLVSGENNSQKFSKYILESIKTIYDVEYNNDKIRRINVNIAPLTNDQYKKLKESKIGTYQLFQETFHKVTYKDVHPSGPKKDYDKRLEAIENAISCGIDDVGIGVLFGLYDYKFEVIALMQYVEHLEKKFNIGPHTISVPRLEPAPNSEISKNPLYPVSDIDLKRIIAILRLAVPYVGLILSTREPEKIRDDAINLGISQLSAASRTNPGGYSKCDSLKQFSLGDHRSLDEVISACCESGNLPSFCTSCYRTGRTGEKFMEKAKTGDIKSFCKINAILSFKEYLLRYASKETKKKGDKIIIAELNLLSYSEKKMVEDQIKKLEAGEIDICV